MRESLLERLPRLAPWWVLLQVACWPWRGLAEAVLSLGALLGFGLMLAARGFAVIRGRDYVVPEDVKAVARSVLAHRITVKPELWMTDASGVRVVDAVLGEVPTPATREPARR